MLEKSIKPPNPIYESHNGGVKMFLAGSIEMGKAENWQDKVEETLALSNVLFTSFNPRREEWDSSWEQIYSNPNFYQQVNWELNALDKSDIIFMYFDPNTKSPISLLELGLYAETGKMIVTCPDGFWRKGNVQIVCEKYNIPLFNTLDESLEFLRYKKWD